MGELAFFSLSQLVLHRPIVVNWEMSMGREICAAQQHVLLHSLHVKTQVSFLMNLDFHKEKHMIKMWQKKKHKGNKINE